MKLKKYVNRITACMCAAALAGGLVACSNGEKPEDAAVAGDKNTSAAESHPDTWLTDEMVTISYVRPESSLQPYKPDCATVQWIKDNLNINLEVSTYSDYETKMNTLVAANELPDIFYLWGNVNDLVGTGSLLELSDLIDQYAPNIKADYEKIPALARCKVDGGIYTLSQIRRDENYDQGSVPCIRTDLLEAQGLEIPATWEELYEVLSTLSTAYPDSIAYGTRGAERLLFTYMSPMKGLGGDYGLYQDESGEWHMGCLEEPYKDSLMYINRLYKEGILDNEYLITSADDWKSGLATGKYLFMYDNPVFLEALNTTLREKDPNARLEPIMFLENEEGARLNYGHREHEYSTWGVNADAENKDIIMRFVNWLYSEEGGLLMYYGVEGVHYDMVEGRPQFKQSVVDEYQSRTGDPTYEAGSEIGIGDLFLGMSWHSNYDAAFKSTSDEAWTRERIHQVYKGNMDDVLPQPMEPPYTSQEVAKITEINQKYIDYSKSEINKFVSGERSFNEWEEFVAELIKKGAQERVDITNAAEKRFQEELKN